MTFRIRLIIMRTAVYFILFFSLASSGWAEQLIMGYEENIDQQIVAIFPVENSAKNNILITKIFLENRKSRFDPKRSKYIVYEIKDAAVGKAIPFLTIGIEEQHVIGKIAKVADGYLIPVIRGRKLIELYKYVSGKPEVQMVNLPTQSAQIDNLDKVFFLKDGFITVTLNKDNPALSFRKLNQSEPKELKLQNEAGKLRSIDDVTELNDRVYIVGTAIGNNDSDGRAVWVASFDKQFAQDSLKVLHLDVEHASTSLPKFISSSHSLPSVQVLSRKTTFSPQTLRVFRLDSKATVVWKFNFDKIEGDKTVAIIGICADKYLFSRKSKEKESASATVEYSVINAKGGDVRTWNEKMIFVGALVDVDLYPTHDYVFSFTNFDKLEDKRRQDGWYSWLAYRSDRFMIQQDCNK